MNTTTPQVAPTTEIAGALLLNRLDEATLKQFRTDPKAALVSNLNLDVGDDLAINCVDNSADTVHLALPYYESIDVAKAEKLSDDNMEEIVGGEIFISIIIGAITGAAIGAALGSGLTAGGAIVGAAVGAAVSVAVLTTSVAIAVPVSQQRQEAQYQAGVAAAQAEAGGQPAPSSGGGK